MDEKLLWELFLETGAPEFYLLWRRAGEKPQEETA